MCIKDDQEIQDNKKKRRDINEIVRQSNFKQKIVDILCVIEYEIISEQVNLDVYNQINSVKGLIKNLYKIPQCILIKIMQIYQLLLKLKQPYLDDCIKELQQIIKRYENAYNQLNLTQNTENYEISKPYIIDEYLDMKYITLSPDEKYLLVSSSTQVYIYDILTKLNIKIYKVQMLFGLFSQNSRQIILVTYNKIIIISINNNKKQQQIIKYEIQGCLINNNYLYLTCSSSPNLIKIDLKSNHQIFSYDIPNSCIVKYHFFEDLIALQSYHYFYILNEKTKKLKLKIILQDYRIKQLFLMNKNEIISNNYDDKLIIRIIDYQNNSLIKNKVLPFSVTQLLRGNPNCGYFYLIYFCEFQIIDENLNPIYSGKNNEVYNDQIKNSIQLCSGQTFIINQKGTMSIYYRPRDIKKTQIGLIY